MPQTAPSPALAAPPAGLLFPMDDVDDIDTASDSHASGAASPAAAAPPHPRPRAAAVAPCPAAGHPHPKPAPSGGGRRPSGRPDTAREGGAPKAAAAARAPPHTVVAAGDECCVCLEPFDDDPAALTVCDHPYHLQCIMEWSARSPACPLCYAPLALADADLDALLPRPPPPHPRRDDSASSSRASSLRRGPGAAELEAVLVRLAALHGGGVSAPRAAPAPLARARTAPAAASAPAAAPPRSLRATLSALSSSLVKGLGGGRRPAERR